MQDDFEGRDERKMPQAQTEPTNQSEIKDAVSGDDDGKITKIIGMGCIVGLVIVLGTLLWLGFWLRKNSSSWFSSVQKNKKIITEDSERYDERDDAQTFDDEGGDDEIDAREKVYQLSDLAANVPMYSDNGDYIYGIVAQAEGTVYCRQWNDGWHLVAYNKGETTRIVENVLPVFMQVSGNYIYYCDQADDLNIYRVGIDGTGLTKLSDSRATYLQLDGENLYFTNLSAACFIYKIDLSTVDTDSKGRLDMQDVIITENMSEKVASKPVPGYSAAQYFDTVEEEAEKTYLTATAVQELVSDTFGVEPVISENYMLYYLGEFNELCRLNLKTGLVEGLPEEAAYNLRLYDNKLYYTNASKQIVCQSTGDSPDIVKYDLNARSFEVEGDFLYYTDAETAQIYRYNRTTEEKSIIGTIKASAWK